MALGDVNATRIAEIRAEVGRLGLRELFTADEVEAAIPASGSALVFVNANDDCAATLARPGLAYALQHDRLPETLLTVFAGQSLEAAAKARAYFKGYFPTAPQIGLLVDGEVVHMCDRDDMMKRLKKVDAIADDLTAAFDTHCPPAAE